MQLANAQRYGVDNRLQVLHSCVSSPDVLAAAPPGGFDLIVANPPYIKTAEWELLQPEVKQWEARQGELRFSTFFRPVFKRGGRGCN